MKLSKRVTYPLDEIFLFDERALHESTWEGGSDVTVPSNERLYSAREVAAAAMGLSICVGFWVFGWTDVMFRGMRTMGFYAVTIAWLLALSDPIFLKRESDKK